MKERKAEKNSRKKHISMLVILLASQNGLRARASGTQRVSIRCSPLLERSHIFSIRNVQVELVKR